MSIRHYFLLGIIAIFSLLAVSQTLLVLYFKEQVSVEITEKSQVITKRLLGKAREDLSKRISEWDVETVTVVNAQSVEKNNPPQPPVPSTAPVPPVPPVKTVNKIIAFKTQDMKDELDTVFVHFDDDHVLKNVIRSDHISQTRSESFERFTRLILWSILVSSLIAITMLVLFMNRLTKPIASLNQGFNALAQGNLGTQLPNQGVGELEACISHFNTTSKELEKLHLVEQQFQQQKQLAELGELSRAIAHSLRNPLHTLGLTLEQFWQGQDCKQQASLKAIAEAKIRHLNKSISALLQLSNSETSRNKVVPIQAVVQDILLEVSSSGVGFELELQDNVKLQGSESEIRAMLHTLIVNAIEAQQQNDRKDPIQLKLSMQDEQLRFSVCDHGGGFAPNIMASLFEPHVSSKAEGAGMGLYLAKRIANLYYSGDIYVTNHDQGARVELTLVNHNPTFSEI